MRSTAWIPLLSPARLLAGSVFLLVVGVALSNRVATGLIESLPFSSSAFVFWVPMALVWPLVVILMRSRSFPPWFSVRWLWGGLLAFAVCSSLVNAAESTLGTAFLGLLPLLMLYSTYGAASTAVAHSRWWGERYLGALFLASTLASLIVLGLAIANWRAASGESVDYLNRFTSTFYHGQGMYGSLHLLLGVAGLLAGPPRRRTLFGLSVASGAGLVFVGFSRTWMVGAVAGLAFMLWQRKRTPFAIVAAAAVVILMTSPAASRLLSLHFTDAGAPGTTERLHLWQTATEVALGHPLLGVGPGNYDAFARPLYWASYALPAGVALSGHSNYGSTAAELGLPGLVALVALLLLLSRQAGIAYAVAPERSIMRMAALGLRGMLVATAVAAVFEESFLPIYISHVGLMNVRVPLLLWALVGIVEGLRRNPYVARNALSAGGRP